PPDVLKAESLDDALTALRDLPIESCFVIGGGQIYADAVKHPACKLIQLTQLQSEFDCDTFFPEYANDFVEQSRSELQHENEIKYCFLVLERKCGYNGATIDIIRRSHMIRVSHLQALIAVTVASGIALAPNVHAQGKPDATHGKQAFEKANCVFCHAGGGNSVNPRRPLKGAAFVQSFPDDKSLENLIRHGTKDGAMPAFSVKNVSDADLKDIIAYIRTLTPKSK